MIIYKNFYTDTFEHGELLERALDMFGGFPENKADFYIDRLRDEEFAIARCALDAEPANNDIVVLATLDLWNGKKKAFQLLKRDSIGNVLTLPCGDDIAFYTDRYNFICSDTHHDGTNVYLFRTWKNGLSEKSKRTLLGKWIAGTATAKDISRYTDTLKTTVERLIMQY